MSLNETSFFGSGDYFTGSTHHSYGEDDDSSATEFEDDINNAEWPRSKHHLIEEAVTFISLNYFKKMLYVVRNLALSVLVIGFLTILLRTHVPSGPCPVVYYVIMGYWTWLSVLIIGGQIMHLYFYS